MVRANNIMEKEFSSHKIAHTTVHNLERLQASSYSNAPQKVLPDNPTAVWLDESALRQVRSTIPAFLRQAKGGPRTFTAHISIGDTISLMVTQKVQAAMSQFGDLIAFDPELKDGHFYIKKTGDLLLWVYDHITAGWTDDEIVELLPGLEPNDVKRVRAFIEALI